jgi:hypothetical protein
VEPSPRSGRPSAATYQGTAGTFLRTNGWVVLLDVSPGHPLVDRCWDELGATTELDDVLETVVAQGLRAVPAFALVRETGTRRVVARGALALVLDGTDVYADRHAGAWVDLPLTGVSTVEVTLLSGVAHGPRLPLRDGVAAAARFQLVLDEPSDRPQVAESDDEDDHLLAETRVVSRARGVVTSVVGAQTLGGPAAGSEATLPTTFTSGLAAASDEGRPGRDLAVSRPHLSGSGDDIETPRVLAAVCPAGHLTPAYSGICRVCRREVAAQEAFETSRPALGRLVLPDGGSLLLDRGAVLGRAPHVPADWAGTQPHLVALPDPDHDVSAQHVAVVLDLWNVLVCDLGSTNGTQLLDEGGQVTTLRPYESAALGAGGAIVLADVLTLPFEVHP